MSTQSPRALISETASLQSLEIQLASLQLLLQSISRRVYRWLAGGFQLFALSLAYINRPWTSLPFVVSIVLPLIGVLCVTRNLPLARCVDWSMQVIVWLFLVQLVYPKAANLWAVRWLTRLLRAVEGTWLTYLLAFVPFTRGVIIFRLLRWRAYMRTKHTIATIFVRQAFFDGLEWLQQNRTALRQLTPTFTIWICRQALIHIVFAGLLKLLINRDFRLPYISAFSCQLVWWVINIMRGKLKHIKWDQRTTTSVYVSPDTPQYVYTPLPNDEKTIRLLLLHPRYPKGLVQCSLIRTTIDTAPRFEAVSYTWGSLEKPATILLDDTAFKITANAFDLLRGMSSHVFPRILWIDSICIDQSSVIEKTHQVQLMSAIYHRAFQVTVWLNHPFVGETDNPHAQYKAAVDAAYAQNLVYELSLLHTLILPRAAYITRYIDPNGVVRKMGPLARLVQNQWFERVWVIQEVVLARTVKVLYAGVEIDWSTVVTGLVQLVDKTDLLHLTLMNPDLSNPSITVAGTTKMDCLGLINIARIRFAKQRLVSVGDALFMSRGFKASDFRDHVFGLTGLCGKDRDGWMTPDYTLKLSDVFIRASLRLIEEEGPNLMIALAGIGFYTDKTPGLEDLPSWAADWSRKTIMPLSDHPSTTAKVIYAAGGLPRGTIRCRHSGMSLYLLGHIFDEVAHLCPVLGSSLGTEQRINILEAARAQKTLLGLLETWIMLYPLLSDTYHFLASPITRFEAFWRVLIGDRTIDKRPAPLSLADSFTRWVQMMLKDAKDFSEGVESADIDFHSDWFQDFWVGSEYANYVRSRGIGRRIAVTKKGYIGLFPPFTEVGDVVCVVEGAPTPFTLRPVDSQWPLRYQLVGENFVLGIMDGEALPPADLLSVIQIV